MSALRHVVLTGAGGFVGAHLAARLLDHPALAQARFTLVDLVLPGDLEQDPRVEAVRTDVADPALPAGLVGEDTDVILHLAGILGGAAEADPALARRVNVDASLALLEVARALPAPPRFVFASSIAVFGPPLPALISDDTLPRPLMIYGAQKLMVEVAIEQFSARGFIDGLALRLPAIVARPPGAANLKSAFLNTLFHAVATGEDITLPVSSAGTGWFLSVEACAEAFIHAALLPKERLGARRAFTLPAQCIAIGDLVAALKRRFPESRSMIRYAPDAEIEAQFTSQPPLETTYADGLGFRHDGDIDTLVAHALPHPAGDPMTRRNA